MKARRGLCDGASWGNRPLVVQGVLLQSNGLGPRLQVILCAVGSSSGPRWNPTRVSRSLSREDKGLILLILIFLEGLGHPAPLARDSA